MACSLTIPQVRDRTKTETRRPTWTWVDLNPGDRVTLVEKGMGLKKGERQVVLAEVEVVSNTRPRLSDITQAQVDAEGFPHMTPAEFVAFWIAAHRAQLGRVGADTDDLIYCRRIVWRYLCAFGDPTCPCRDGGPCHYVSVDGDQPSTMLVSHAS